MVICDGVQGKTASLFGLNDTFIQHSCKAYGAIATINQLNACSIPAPEIRVHNLTFNLAAFKKQDNKATAKRVNNNNNHSRSCSSDETSALGFHLKVFGSQKQRFLTLAVPSAEAKLIKAMKLVNERPVSAFI